ncbi:tRNA pseudouridine(38-40) synthase TruA [Roseococcus sp. SYP-B2431]|uniref:tRNA pseudouridine(38-40) synthase TruA n=1 Tax=Roseococcus sp. SYP-B2431 TaxID=2496640 RepID=UPI00103AA348|nr:tRNA pseudouridine(38-40) synthase TruA [Roseococcus sp. SYP-B2431]TCI00455.1 tRNA pseudouridine(38-40) synthase TruA [Roseococcus sp. SYP-B2431]
MPSYALLVEYDGTAFFGWQRQASGPSVQQAIEEAASALNGGVVPLATASGRTDSGVHAEGQVVQLELSAGLPPDRMRAALDFHVRPHRIAIRAAAFAPEGWSPRFSAVQRHYRYRILARRAKPALEEGRVWHVPLPLDTEAMHAAAQGLLGKHDFSAYRAASCQADSPLRTLDRLDVIRTGEEIHVLASARSFLHHQVRNLVGTLYEVGLGRRPVRWPREVLDGQDRRLAGQTAPPQGLCFLRVDFPEPLDWR